MNTMIIRRDEEEKIFFGSFFKERIISNYKRKHIRIQKKGNLCNDVISSFASSLFVLCNIKDVVAFKVSILF